MILAVWKSSRLLAAQGRLSYRLSNHESKNEDTTSSVGGAVLRARKPRGWWDYVPPPTNAKSSRQPVVTHTSLNAKNGGLFSVLKGLFREATPVEPPRKPSLHSEYPIPAQTGRSRSRSNASQAVSPRPGLLVPHRRINIKPRVLLFREVMRDEVSNCPAPTPGRSVSDDRLLAMLYHCGLRCLGRKRYHGSGRCGPPYVHRRRQLAFP